MTRITITNQYQTITIEVPEDDMNLDDMHELWLKALSGLGYTGAHDYYEV